MREPVGGAHGAGAAAHWPFGSFPAAAMLLLVCMLTTAWVGFAVNLAITPLTAACAALVWLLIMLGCREARRRWRAVSVLALSVIALHLLSVAAASVVFDGSYDGLTYHDVSEIALVRGWNPLRHPHLLDWWNERFPELRYLGEQISDGGLWSSHYPSGSWILGAQTSVMSGSLPTAKWLQFFLAATAAAAFWQGLRDLGMGALFAGAASTAGAFSPVVLAQLNTGYVDGMLGSMLMVQIGAALSWLARRRIDHFFILTSSLIISAGLKFTGAFYSGVIVSGVLAYGFMRWRRLDRAELTVLALTATAFLACSHTYLHNTAEHGNPFYPLNDRDVVAGQISQEFLAKSRIDKFISGMLNVPYAATGAEHSPIPLTFSIPRLWHYYILMQIPDTRISGFGEIFGFHLIFSIPILILCLFFTKRHLCEKSKILLVLLFIITVTILANPASWWARYVPQLWLVPILIAALCWTTGLRRTAYGMILPSVLVVGICSTIWVKLTLDLRSEQQSVFRQISAAQTVRLADDWYAGAPNFAAYHLLRERGVSAGRAKAPTTCDVKIGFARACLTP